MDKLSADWHNTAYTYPEFNYGSSSSLPFNDLIVVDAKQGLVGADSFIANLIRKNNKKNVIRIMRVQTRDKSPKRGNMWGL